MLVLLKKNSVFKANIPVNKNAVLWADLNDNKELNFSNSISWIMALQNRYTVGFMVYYILNIIQIPENRSTLNE